MRRLVSSVLGAAAAAGLAVAGLVAAAAPAQAAACSGTSGVTVVVDTGSSVITRCAPGDPTSGFQALSLAGFTVTQVQTQPGFVCRINSFPSTDPCRNTPPATAYWAYYHAARGGSWSYSSIGAGSYDPQPGSVEGWRFGSGQRPGIAPPAPTATSAPKPASTSTPRATTVTPKPAATPQRTTTAPRATSAPGGTAAGVPAPRTSATQSATSPASPSTSPSAGASTTSSAGATPSDSSSASDPPTPHAAAPAAADGPAGGSSGGPAPLLAGGALIAVVAGGAGWTVWRRRD